MTAGLSPTPVKHSRAGPHSCMLSMTGGSSRPKRKVMQPVACLGPVVRDPSWLAPNHHDELCLCPEALFPTSALAFRRPGFRTVDQHTIGM
jgi:hypothetical protein